MEYFHHTVGSQNVKFGHFRVFLGVSLAGDDDTLALDALVQDMLVHDALDLVHDADVVV